MASEIKVDTISEKTSAGGVTIDGLLIKDGGISGDVSLIGTTPTFTIGDAGAEDAALVFDGNAQDFYIGLDDSADDLVIGLGSAVGTTPAISINEDRDVTISDGAIDFDVASHDTSNGLKLGGTLVTATAAELNIMDGVTSTAAEINLIDGGTARGTTAIADGDGVLINDGGTMRMTTVETLTTYIGAVSTLAGLTDVSMDITNFTDGLLIQTNSDGSAPSTGTLSGATDNIGIGKDVFGALTTGDKNVVIGNTAGDALADGEFHVMIGYNAGGAINSATNCVLIGKDAGKSLTTGSTNIFIGVQAGDGHDAESWNIGIGFDALGGSIAGGEYNTVIGGYAGDALTSGDSNTFVGHNAGTTNTAGANNICIGNATDGAAVDNTYSIGIGDTVTAETNQFTFGKNGNEVTNEFISNANWSQSSDERIKRNIANDTLGLDFINDLRTVTYQWKPSNEIPTDLFKHYNAENKKDLSVTMHGMIAQEVKSALDTAGVSTFSGWAVKRDGSQDVSREMFVIPLIKAVQELTAKVDALTARVVTLEG